MSPAADSNELLLFVVGISSAIFLCVFCIYCYCKNVMNKESKAKENERIQVLERRRQRQLQLQLRPKISSVNRQYSEVDLLKFFQFHIIDKHNKSKIFPERKKPAQLKTKLETVLEQNKFNSDDTDVEKGAELSYGCCTSESSTKASSVSTINVRRPLFDIFRSLLGISQSLDDVAEDEEEWCSICLKGYEEGQVICTPKTGHCQHIFHKECLFAWAKKGRSECPLCCVDFIE